MRIENDLIHEAAARQLSLDEYKELLILLSNTPKACLLDSISPTDLVKMLSFMDFENEEISDVAERIAKLIFPLFPLDFVQESSEMFVTIFSVDNYHLTLLIFNELTNVVKLFKSQGDVIIFTDEVMTRVVDMIFNQYLELSWTAQGLLISYCDQSPDICHDMLKKVMKPKFSQLLSNSVNVFRYIDVGIEIVLKSKQSHLFETIIDGDVIAMINGIINGEDILAQMNVLEVIKKVIGDRLGYRLMIDRKILDNLYKKLPAISDCPCNIILLPGYLSVFGKLCRTYPGDTLDRFANMLSVLQEQFDATNISLRLQSLEIFSSFASVPQCKLQLADKHESIVAKALSASLELLSSSDPDQQARAANVLAHLLSATNDEIAAVNLTWSTTLSLGDTLVSSITRMVALPIEPMKVAALNMALALSTQTWGQTLLCAKVDLIEYLLIRSDQWQSCIDLKFELIGNLIGGIERCGVTGLCSTEIATKLAQYHSEGKYFGASHREMMVDTDV